MASNENIRVEISKSDRTLRVFEVEKLIKTFSIALGFSPVGDKEIEGDGKTPEGSFYIFTKNSESKFHLSLGISYPSTGVAKRGLEANLISQDEFDSITKSISEKGKPLQKTKLGGEIYIHGGGIEDDWTDGCIALMDKEIEELFNLVPVGAIVEIRP
jgi:murein L,D-transpeptidase YafK